MKTLFLTLAVILNLTIFAAWYFTGALNQRIPFLVTGTAALLLPFAIAAFAPFVASAKSPDFDMGVVAGLGALAVAGFMFSALMLRGGFAVFASVCAALPLFIYMVITAFDRADLLPSDQKKSIDNKIGWAMIASGVILSFFAYLLKNRSATGAETAVASILVVSPYILYFVY
jgi:hypothetical protein